MTIHRTFKPREVLADARAGRLTRMALRKAIATAEEFGNSQVAEQLRLILREPPAFAGDAAPPEIQYRAAQRISALAAMGIPLNRTRQMFMRYGVIATISHIAQIPATSKNFKTLCGAGLKYLTAEAIVLHRPHLFDPNAVEAARKRLGR